MGAENLSIKGRIKAATPSRKAALLRMRARLFRPTTYSVSVKARILQTSFTSLSMRARLQRLQRIEIRAKILPYRFFIFCDMLYSIRQESATQARMVFYVNTFGANKVLSMQAKIEREEQQIFTGHFIVAPSKPISSIILVQTLSTVRMSQHLSTRCMVVKP